MATAHALLSPSAAHRWMNCALSARLCEGMADKGSDYAREGTLAHARCALKLKEYLRKDSTAEREEIESLREYQTGEMDEYTDGYFDLVTERYEFQRRQTPDARLLVETRLDFCDYIPDSFGTADAVIIADGCMDVIDFKYGKGVTVSAVGNPQMRIYALGALSAFGNDYDIRRVRMSIIQPRVENYSSEEVDVRDLQEWAERELKPKARAAYLGVGQATPGDWCKFCKGSGVCKGSAQMAAEVFGQHRDAAMLTDRELAEDVLPRLPLIRSWLAAVEEYALTRAMSGATLPGYKVVEGRSNRRITDAAGVAEALTKGGLGEAAFMRPPQLMTITELEKSVGKKRFGQLCGRFITKPQGKPTLVPASDKRPAFNAAAEDFKNININD